MTTSNTCGNCRYFNPNNGEHIKVGNCRRFPPTPLPMPQQSVIGGGGMGLAGVFPPTSADNTCGEHSDDTTLTNQELRKFIVERLQELVRGPA